MARLFLILSTITALTACSSGVSNTGAGGAGTNCGKLVCTATLAPDNFSSDAFASDTDDPPDGVADELVSADFATMTITINDPLGQFSRVFQGATFNRFRVTFRRVNGGAPKLGPRDIADVINITLSDGTGTGNTSLPIVDNVTKQQFRDQASGSTVFVYTVVVEAFGKDFATNSNLVVEGRATIEIGEFIQSEGGD
jgi:hypothetical protein